MGVVKESDSQRVVQAVVVAEDAGDVVVQGGGPGLDEEEMMTVDGFGA